MANSNARSSAYRAGGGWKQWGSIKGSDNTVKMDTPKPPHIEQYLQEQADKNDEYHLTKADIRATLESDSEGIDVTVVPEGMTAKKAKKQKKGLTRKKKPSTVKPSKRSNRSERRALAQKVEKERLDKRKQFK
jgi:hypothetical protein